PELVVRIISVAGHVGRRHPERKGLNLELALTALESIARERIDLLHLGVGHGIAASGRTRAMHHKMRTIPPVHAVIGVRTPHVERKVILRRRVHLMWTDRVETLRRLTVTLGKFWPQLTRPFADVVTGSQVVTPVILALPDLQLR